ncbi:MAG: DUF1080 domain-containing protein [Planctomycetota bacterium]|nr:DUF1080 domain-containing protein [Planctomycetota bacterium]
MATATDENGSDSQDSLPNSFLRDRLLMIQQFLFLVAFGLIHVLVAVGLTNAKGPVVTDPQQAGPEYAVQGEYTGNLGPDNDQLKVGVQIISLGQGNFRVVLHKGGLPGDGWNRGGKTEAEAKIFGDTLTFQQGDMRLVWTNGQIKARLEARAGSNPVHEGTLHRIVRESPTIGLRPPAEAIILFDGTSTEGWVGDNGKIAAMSEGLLHEGVRTNARFLDHQMHLEFRTPFQPEENGQGRGNSGLYLQGRYEVQILDSFGLSGESNECGGIYRIARPQENLCLPPLQWQTYDIDFIAARYDAEGKLVRPAYLTVRHNGVLIHDHVEMNHITGGNQLPAGPEPGFVYLQDHQNPVRFRNIWAVAKPDNVSVPTAGSNAVPLPERWASPRELRNKKMIGTGQHSIQEGLTGVGPEFLLMNPGFCDSHPFDGITVTAPLAAEWLTEIGRTGSNSVLDNLVWANVRIPYAAVEKTIRDLQQVKWGHLTDNFLWYRLSGEGPDGPLASDFTNDTHWANIQHNAALSARLCKEANLKGFMLDTEQYSSYALRDGEVAEKNKEGETISRPFPLGRDTPQLLRQRGRQWIRAVQSEYPDITIVIFFGWSPDLDSAGFLSGVKPFLDGILEGIEGNARLVHGYENTFYYGHAPNSRYTEPGFPGQRHRYEWARNAMHDWRNLSIDPHKYDQYVEPGMAAWVESDPWDLWNGWPQGTRDTIWSNLPLALAYSDEYVWVWSEHTHFGHSYTLGKGANPFLTSLSNQTFNTGREATASVTENFASDPLSRGWYFDFDMLDVARKTSPEQTTGHFSLDAVPYAWSYERHAVKIRGAGTSGVDGATISPLGYQRRRYVHPLKSLATSDRLQMNLDFQIEKFGGDVDNPMILGLFRSDRSVSDVTLSLQISSPTLAHLVVAGNGSEWRAPLTLNRELAMGKKYRWSVEFQSTDGKIAATLSNTTNADSIEEVSQLTESIPMGLRHCDWDEVGAALGDGPNLRTPAGPYYEWLLQRVDVQAR